MGCFKFDNTSISTFDKKENNYCIIENFDILNNHLLVKFIGGKLTYEEVTVPDILPIQRTEMMLYIIENSKVFMIDLNLLEVEMCSIIMLNIFLIIGEVGIIHKF